MSTEDLDRVRVWFRDEIAVLEAMAHYPEIRDQVDELKVRAEGLCRD